MLYYNRLEKQFPAHIVSTCAPRPGCFSRQDAVSRFVGHFSFVNNTGIEAGGERGL